MLKNVILWILRRLQLRSEKSSSVFHATHGLIKQKIRFPQATLWLWWQRGYLLWTLRLYRENRLVISLCFTGSDSFSTFQSFCYNLEKNSLKYWLHALRSCFHYSPLREVVLEFSLASLSLHEEPPLLGSANITCINVSTIDFSKNHYILEIINCVILFNF